MYFAFVTFCSAASALCRDKVAQHVALLTLRKCGVARLAVLHNCGGNLVGRSSKLRAVSIIQVEKTMERIVAQRK